MDRIVNNNCKDQLWLKPGTGMDLGPRSPNNKFIESGRKWQSESRIKILVYSVKRKELHAHRCKKYPRTCLSTRTKSTEFFIFTVVFLQHFPFFLCFFFLVCFSIPLSLNPFRIIYYGFYTISSIHVWVRCWKSFFSILPYLFLNLPFLAVRLLVHCSGITSTLMRPESQLGSI